MRWRSISLIALSLLGIIAAILVWTPTNLLTAQSGTTHSYYFPFIAKAEEVPIVHPTPVSPPSNNSIVEFRGIWVTRFDWTTANQPASPTEIDKMVNNIADAGFNVIFFQVRGAADAFYTPGLEPWSQRVSGKNLGDPPPFDWDPLAYFVEKAHARNLELHAYINTYPVYDKCDATPPTNLTPRHFYHQLTDIHGVQDGKNRGLQWDINGNIHCAGYQRATPASSFAQEHIVSVGKDLVRRYDIDGIHLDHIRYSGQTTSCDPISGYQFGGCNTNDTLYQNWQREQVNTLVKRYYNEVVTLKENVWLSAAVWPIYRDYWDWQVQEGYENYYQDSLAWVWNGYIDAISPMIYPAHFNCPDDSFWTESRWKTLAQDFYNKGNARHILPGIGTRYCTFDEIERRITHARNIGTPGHALFSYSGLAYFGYFDDLANGPYKVQATVPDRSWR